LSFEPTSIPLPSSLRDKPLVELAAPIQNVAPPVAANKPNVRIEPTGSVSKQLKIVTPQQQAENEFRKANLLAQQGRFKEAATGYAAALHLDPVHDMAREALVAVLLESKLNADAERVLQEGLKQNPKQTHFAMLLARLQVERNALPAALDTLEKALPYAEQLGDYQAFMAALLQRQNRHKEAITHYQIALQLSPNSGLWLMGLGISLQAVQRKEDARDAYMRAIESHSLSPELQAFVAQRLKAVRQ
jgi:MSHA biogenesis protein MshN